MSKGHTLQDPYLNALRKERVPVSIYLVKRHQATGSDRVLRPIRGFVEEHGVANGLQARHFHCRPIAQRAHTDGIGRRGRR